MHLTTKFKQFYPNEAIKIVDSVCCTVTWFKIICGIPFACVYYRTEVSVGGWVGAWLLFLFLGTHLYENTSINHLQRWVRLWKFTVNLTKGCDHLYAHKNVRDTVKGCFVTAQQKKWREIAW